jgi:hypothetical protein
MKDRYLIGLIFGLVFLLAGQIHTYGQEKPPRPMQVRNYQDLNFGTFYKGVTGGDVIIDAWGGRTVTGDVIAIGSMSYCPAIFEIDVEPGTRISWVGSTTSLTGSNGGSMELEVSSTENSRVAAADVAGIIRLSVGGVLTISPTTIPGSYTGSFAITFIQE